ncbi:MAG: DNA polymerase III subunit gamma/tau [Candidatus Omnitrophica bacterium]|nr:DNA polymerase III subunit gamma/tau [Candidatus Omnitrophota bacterium]
MAYVVFALKWRPQNFDEIVGQDHIVVDLKGAIEKDRVAHAYLFAGPRGVGKTSTARILAKALNCKNRKGPNPCGTCSSCVEITQGSSLDVIEIDGASNRGIDEIRALRENVKFSPTQGKFKIYIIDEVHQITTDGFNALLKTLEEPPPFVKFIFATTSSHKVMPTILSRCQRLDFRRISTMELIEQLDKIVKAEGMDVDQKVLAAIARASDGALRDAESILDQLIAFSKGKVTLEDINSMLGLVEQDVLFEITEAVTNKDAAKALRLLNTMIDNGKDPGVFLNNLIDHFRNLMIAKVAQADAQLIDLPHDVCEKLLQQSRKIALETILSNFTILINAQEMAKRLDSVRIALEVSLVRLSHPAQGTESVKPVNSSSVQPKEKSSRQYTTPAVSRPVFPPRDTPVREQGIKPAPPAKNKRPEINAEDEQDLLTMGGNISSLEKDPVDDLEEKKQTIATAVSITRESVKSEWENLISQLSRVKMSVATYLNEGTVVSLEGHALTIAFPKHCSLHKESLEGKENKALIERTLAELINGHVRVHFILSDEDSAKSDSSKDPMVQSVLDAFKGRVVKEE